ncbi:hypothetical protein [Lysinibacillus sp. NPDC056232]|uniref:hypothetical protein n=1 Tax=Lysinibacillus sp. NPDC056232 TaxID=3345756 RepID=UPI0035DDC4E7
MSDEKNFKDLPAGKSISYQHLLFYLEQGREIEFVYKEKEYFISHSLEGRTVWNGQKRISEHFRDNDVSLLESTKIEGRTLADLLKQNEIKITAIF